MTRRTFFASGLASGAGLATLAVPARAQASPPKIANGIVGGRGITINCAGAKFMAVWCRMTKSGVPVPTGLPPSRRSMPDSKSAP